jgi:hypothetical protein
MQASLPALTTAPRSRTRPNAAGTGLSQALEIGCNKMGEEQRAWLSVTFTACHEALTRTKPFTCDRRRGLKVCVESMDQKTYVDYIGFHRNVAK